MLAVFSRYVLVQVFAYALDMGTFLLGSSLLGWHPLAANVVAKAIAGAFAFAAHRHMTFGVNGMGGGRHQFIKYVLLLLLNIPLSSGALALLLLWIEPEVLAKFVSDVICVGITFFLSRHFVFTTPQPDHKAT